MANLKKKPTAKAKKSVKAATKKAPVKKVAVKKIPAKKPVAKKKPAVKKAVAKQIVAKKKPAAAKKSAVKKIAVKKSPMKKGGAKKVVAAKMSIAKKVVIKKIAAKKPVAKKKPVAVKKTVAKKVAVKKAAIKKPVAKKLAVKKAAPKKAPVKKIVSEAVEPRVIEATLVVTEAVEIEPVVEVETGVIDAVIDEDMFDPADDVLSNDEDDLEPEAAATEPVRDEPVTVPGDLKDLPERLRDAALRVLDERQAEDIVTVSLAGRSSVADYMIIASGRAGRQVSAIADHLREAFFKLGVKQVRIEGQAEANWVLVDAGDVLIHLFRPEVRKYYDLDSIWNARPGKA